MFSAKWLELLHLFNFAKHLCCVSVPMVQRAVMRGGLQGWGWLLGPLCWAAGSTSAGQWEATSWNHPDKVPAGPSLGPHLLQLGPRSPRNVLVQNPSWAEEFQQTAINIERSLVWFGKTFRQFKWNILWLISCRLEQVWCFNLVVNEGTLEDSILLPFRINVASSQDWVQTRVVDSLLILKPPSSQFVLISHQEVCATESPDANSGTVN